MSIRFLKNMRGGHGVVENCVSRRRACRRNFLNWCVIVCDDNRHVLSTIDFDRYFFGSVQKSQETIFKDDKGSKQRCGTRLDSFQGRREEIQGPLSTARSISSLGLGNSRFLPSRRNQTWRLVWVLECSGL